jgi:hypothetical protein
MSGSKVQRVFPTFGSVSSVPVGRVTDLTYCSLIEYRLAKAAAVYCSRATNNPVYSSPIEIGVLTR